LFFIDMNFYKFKNIFQITLVLLIAAGWFFSQSNFTWDKPFSFLPIEKASADTTGGLLAVYRHASHLTSDPNNPAPKCGTLSYDPTRYKECYIGQEFFDDFRDNSNNPVNYFSFYDNNDLVHFFAQHGLPSDNIKIEWEGLLKIDYNEVYTFYSDGANDSFWLRIDEIELINGGGNKEGKIYLEAGWHKFEAELREGTLTAKVALSWKASSIPVKTPIPLDHFLPITWSNDITNIPSGAKDKISYKTAGIGMAEWDSANERFKNKNLSTGASISLTVPSGVSANNKKDIWLYWSGNGGYCETIKVNDNNLTGIPLLLGDSSVTSVAPADVYKAAIPETWVPDDGQPWNLSITNMDCGLDRGTLGASSILTSAFLTSPYGVYILEDNNEKNWYFRTTLGPSSKNYSGTKISVPYFSSNIKIVEASFYNPEAGETIDCLDGNNSPVAGGDNVTACVGDIKTILINSMSVNGTGGVDGINFKIEKSNGKISKGYIKFDINFSGTISTDNIFIGQNKINPLSIPFNLNSGGNNGAALILPYKDESLPEAQFQIKGASYGHSKLLTPSIFTFPALSAQDAGAFNPLFIMGNGETIFTGSPRPNYIFFAHGSGAPPNEFSNLKDNFGGQMISPQSYPYSSGDTATWYPSFGREEPQFDILSPEYIDNTNNSLSSCDPDCGKINPVLLDEGDTWFAFQLASLSLPELDLGGPSDYEGTGESSLFLGAGGYMTGELLEATSKIEVSQNGTDWFEDSVTIDYGSNAYIRWSSTNVDSCTVTPDGWTGTSNSEYPGGRDTGGLNASKTYYLDCVGTPPLPSPPQDSVTVKVRNFYINATTPISAKITGEGVTKSSVSTVTVVPIEGFAESVNLSVVLDPVLSAIGATYEFIGGFQTVTLEQANYATGWGFDVFLPAGTEIEGSYTITVNGDAPSTIIPTRTESIQLNIDTKKPVWREF